MEVARSEVFEGHTRYVQRLDHCKMNVKLGPREGEGIVRASEVKGFCTHIYILNNVGFSKRRKRVSDKE